MPYEIDYIPVGKKKKSGDAILLRFGNLSGPRSEQIVVVIDGGFKDSGEKIVQHLTDFYNTNKVDLVISTHPDNDHISGLRNVLEKCDVTNLLMHRPWNHTNDIKNFFKNKNITTSGLEKKLEKSLQTASDLEDLATKNDVNIIEPFQGVTGFNNTMQILGPSEEYYKELIPLFRNTPAPINALSFLAPVQKFVKSVVNWIEDRWDIDLLNDDEDTTSPENNTSVITLFVIDGKKLLFTGDAGKTALLKASDYANGIGIPLNDLSFFDVPHHGSKRNLSSKVLSKVKSKTSFVSAAKKAKKHPSKKITNALKKTGSSVFVNKGSTLRHHYNAPDRPNWVSAQEEIFYDKVEE